MKNMEISLIKQLKKTHKWSEFEKWWESKYSKIEALEDTEVSFDYWWDFPFEFQESVFKKFLKSDTNYRFEFLEQSFCNSFEVYIFNYTTKSYIMNVKTEKFDTIEELILWYFNQ